MKYFLTFGNNDFKNQTIIELYKILYVINDEIWNIEDKIRLKEKNQIFDDEFIDLARSVYIKNDQRAFIKKQINIFSKSNFIEEKSYIEYRN
jgi:hypothetical protein